MVPPRGSKQTEAGAAIEAIYRHAPLRILHVRRDGTFTASAAAEAFLDAFGAPEPATTLHEITPLAATILTRTLAGRPWHAEACKFSLNGQTLTTAVDAYPIRGDENTAGAIVLIHQERSLVDKMQSTFFEEGEDMFCIADVDGHFVELSPSWSRHLGWRLEDLKARPWIEFVHPEDMNESLHEAARAKGQQATLRFENRYRCVDGSYKWLQWNTYAPPGSQYTYSVARDVTAQHAALDQLQVAYKTLEEADKARISFFQQAIHDLSGPLTPMKIIMAKQAESPHADQSDLTIMRRVVGHLEALVKNLRETGTIQSDRLELHREVQDIQILATPTLLVHEQVAAQRGIDLRSNLGSALVDADPFRVSQVLYNLLGNALKFTPEGGAIQVTSERSDHAAMITVTDTGRGLEEQDIQRLFEPFTQVHDPREVKEKGTGLGLYISRAIVEAHGGRIWVESEGRGHGCAFHFTLPLAATIHATP